MVGEGKFVVCGKLSLGDVEATGVGNFSGVLRERFGCLVGECRCFSELRCRLVCSVGLFGFFWNFVNEFEWGFSSAKFEGLTVHLWSWHEFVYCKSNIL